MSCSTGQGEDSGEERAANPTAAGDRLESETEQQRDVLGQAEAEALREEEAQLDLELHVIRRMRLAFEASLQMFEAVRDDLEAMGDRMDRLTAASKRCRLALRDKKEREA
jgi:hypothetical protein